MHIGRKDLLWNYAATFLKIASSALLLPFILRMMPAEMVGIWTVFITITAFTGLLDFGFNPSFSRNVTYIFSGVRILKTNGFEVVPKEAQEIDFGLLKGLISAMRWLYLRMAIILFLLLTTLGTFYITWLLKAYNGNPQEVLIAWSLLCLISTYNIFTIYYDSLLLGKGLVKKSKQIIIIGNIAYMVLAAFFIFKGYGLIALISAQAASVLIIRLLSYKAFFTVDIKKKLNEAICYPKMEILKAIYPNAVKIGLTSLGSFMIQKSAIIIGSLYLTLVDIASYGITMQLIAVIAGLAGIYTTTFHPKISQFRVEHNIPAIREIYLKGQTVMVLTYLMGGICLIGIGNWALATIDSQTQLMPNILIFMALILSLIESNLSIAGGIILTKNEVPFFKASLISGASIVIGFIVLFGFTTWGIIILILVPLVVDIAYQAWKWPLVVFNDLHIKLKFKLIRR